MTLWTQFTRANSVGAGPVGHGNTSALTMPASLVHEDAS